MKKMMMMVAVFGLAFGAYAQDDAERRTVAEEMMAMMKIQEGMDQIFDLIAAQLKSALPAVDAAKMSKMMDKLMVVFKEELSWEKMKGEYIDLYAKAFTVDEMKAIIAFYKTPAGKALLEKQPELMKQGMEIGQKATLRMMPKIQVIIAETMTE